jgi:hypothetical protein
LSPIPFANQFNEAESPKVQNNPIWQLARGHTPQAGTFLDGAQLYHRSLFPREFGHSLPGPPYAAGSGQMSQNALCSLIFGKNSCLTLPGFRIYLSKVLAL